jgi:hypothetical protein
MKNTWLFLLLLPGLPALAQTVIPSIPGWKTEHNNDHYIFHPITLFNSSPATVYELMPPEPAVAGDATAWLKAAALRNLEQTGYSLADVSAARQEHYSSILTYTAMVFDNRRTKWQACYLLYTTAGGQMRWARIISAPTHPAYKKNLQTAISHFFALAQKEGGLPNNTASATVPATDNEPRNISSNATVAAPATGTGLRAAGIKGIILVRHYGLYGPYLDSYLLLTDGSIYEDTRPCPYDFDAARSKQAEAKKWGSWKTQGNTLVIQWNGKPKPAVYGKNEWFWTRPAEAGEKISGGYKTLSTGGNVPLGGNVMTFAASNIHFNTQGQFTIARSSGGSAPSVSAYSSKNEAGTYQLNGYSIELRFNNGKVVRQGFYFYPDGKDHFGMGGSDYVPEKN